MLGLQQNFKNVLLRWSKQQKQASLLAILSSTKMKLQPGDQTSNNITWLQAELGHDIPEPVNTTESTQDYNDKNTNGWQDKAQLYISSMLVLKI